MAGGTLAERAFIPGLRRLYEQFGKARVDALVEQTVDEVQKLLDSHRSGLPSAEVAERMNRLTGRLRLGDQLEQAVYVLLFSDSRWFDDSDVQAS
jgi:hypothetical protein